MNDTTVIVFTSLVVLAAALFASAGRISDALVRARARGLPMPLARRMEEEWRGELHAIASRPGKLAFAIALTLTRRRAFVAPGEDSMEIHDRPGAFAVLGGWKALLIIPTAVFALAAYGASFLLPIQYHSEALVVMQPQSIPKDLVHGLPESSLEDRFEGLTAVALSRISPVRILHEFDLYKGSNMDNRILKLRENISFRFKLVPGYTGPIGSVSVRYVGADPLTVQRVTRDLTDSVVRQDSESREKNLQGATNFLAEELDKIAARLTEQSNHLKRERAGQGQAAVRALNYELLQSEYRKVFAQHEELQRVTTLEAKQRGGKLVIMDRASTGTPVIPNRLMISAFGASGGFAIGGMAVAGLYRRQRRLLAQADSANTI